MRGLFRRGDPTPSSVAVPVPANTPSLVKTTRARNFAPLRGVPKTSKAVSGNVHFDGVLYWDDYDKMWNWDERDRTIIRMQNDPILSAALTGIEMLIRRVKWTVKPPDGSREAEEIATYVQTCFDDMTGQWPGETMSKILTFLPWGWSVLETIYKVREGANGRTPSRYDDGKIGWARWSLIPQRTRGGWEFNRIGEPILLIQLDPMDYHDIPISLQRCLHFKYGGKSNSPEGDTPLRGAYDAWWRKSRIQQIEGIGIERDLTGLPLMRIPGVDIKERSEVYTAAQSIVTGVRMDTQSGVIISSDRDPDTEEYLQTFELMATLGQRAISTDAVIRRYANELATVFLANVMRAGQDTHGSFALADAQGGMLENSIIAHLDLIGDVITSQAITRLCAINNFPEHLTPKLVNSGLEGRDLQILGTYLVQLAKTGMLLETPQLVVFLHDVAGLPVPDVETVKKEFEQKQLEREAAIAAEKAANAALLNSQRPSMNEGEEDAAEEEDAEEELDDEV